MKKFIAMLLALAMVLSLAACGSRTDAPAETKAQTAAEKPAATEKTEEPAPAAEPVTLTRGSWVFAEDSVRPIYQEMADLYNETNEYNTTISTEYFYSYADYLSTLLIDVAGGNGPDVAHIKAEWLPQLLETGAIIKPSFCGPCFGAGLRGKIGAADAADGRDGPRHQAGADRHRHHRRLHDGTALVLQHLRAAGEYRSVRAGWR